MTAEHLNSLATQAESALCRADWATAAANYEKLVRAQPRNFEQRFRLARAYGNLGREREAVELLREVPPAELQKAKRRLACAYILAKKYAAAIPLLDELLVASPSDSKLRRWKATCVEKTPGNPTSSKVDETVEGLPSAGPLRHEAGSPSGSSSAHPHADCAYSDKRGSGEMLDEIAFSFSVENTVFATKQRRGNMYFHDRVLYFDLPEACCADLTTTDIPELVSVLISVSTEGAPVVLRFFNYGPGGEVVCQERALKSGRTKLLAAIPNPVASRVCLSVSGAGELAIMQLKLVRPKPGKSDGSEAAGAPPNPLVALLMPDYVAARKGGAEIPPPSLSTPF